MTFPVPRGTPSEDPYPENVLVALGCAVDDIRKWLNIALARPGSLTGDELYWLLGAISKRAGEGAAPALAFLCSKSDYSTALNE